MLGKPRNPRHRLGFTLLESVVALTIIGMVAVAALSAVGAQMRTAERANTEIEAVSLATQQFTMLHLLPAEDLQTVPDSLSHGQFPAPLDKYQWQVETSPILGELNLFNVTVTVLWKDGSYTLSSRLFARPRLSDDE